MAVLRLAGRGSARAPPRRGAADGPVRGTADIPLPGLQDPRGRPRPHLPELRNRVTRRRPLTAGPSRTRLAPLAAELQGERHLVMQATPRKQQRSIRVA